MSKSKKKRNKKYQGIDASDAPVRVTRISVPERSAFGKWWYENKKRIIRIMVIIGVTLVLYSVATWLLDLIF